MQNEQLVIRIKAGIDIAENMSLLYEQTRRFIHAVAWQFRGQEELEDLEQEGYLALYSAIDGYDPEQGCKFLTYAKYHIQQRMQRYIQMNRSSLRVPVHRHERINQYNRLCKDFVRDTGRMPTEGETAAHLGLNLEQVAQLLKDAQSASVRSLDAPIKGAEYEDITLADSIAATGSLEDEAVEKAQGEQLKAELWACVFALQGEQSGVIWHRYKEGLTLGEMGKKYGTTPEYIRQQEAKALRELRKPKYTKRLRPFLEEERIYSMGISGVGAERFRQTWTSATERAALYEIKQS